MAEHKEPMMEFTQRGRITVGTVRTASVLSTNNVSDFGNELFAHVDKHPKINLLLDFQRVEYLSSAVLTELLRIHRAISEKGGRMRICGISPVIHEVFQITNLDRIFSVHQEDVETGIQRFERALDIDAEDRAWTKG